MLCRCVDALVGLFWQLAPSTIWCNVAYSGVAVSAGLVVQQPRRINFMVQKTKRQQVTSVLRNSSLSVTKHQTLQTQPTNGVSTSIVTPFSYLGLLLQHVYAVSSRILSEPLSSAAPFRINNLHISCKDDISDVEPHLSRITDRGLRPPW